MTVLTIARSTFREAARDRVLYSPAVFAVLMTGAAILVGQVSIGIERQVVINLGLAAVTFFGVIVAILVGTGLVAKEIQKRTLYTVLSRPVERWQFVAGKFVGLAGTLAINGGLMGLGLLAALRYVSPGFSGADAWVLVAVYFILLQLLMVCGLALLFSTFSSPLLAGVFSFALFVLGNFAQELRDVAQSGAGWVHPLMVGATYLMPNFSAFNVAAGVAHGESIASLLILHNSIYAVTYTGMVLCAAVLAFEWRELQ